MRRVKRCSAVFAVSAMLLLAGCGAAKEDETKTNENTSAVETVEEGKEESDKAVDEDTDNEEIDKKTDEEIDKKTDKKTEEEKDKEATTEAVVEAKTEAAAETDTEAVLEENTEADKEEATEAVTEEVTEAPAPTTEIVPNCVEGGYDVLDSNGNVISHIPAEDGGVIGE